MATTQNKGRGLTVALVVAIGVIVTLIIAILSSDNALRDDPGSPYKTCEFIVEKGRFPGNTQYHRINGLPSVVIGSTDCEPDTWTTRPTNKISIADFTFEISECGIMLDRVNKTTEILWLYAANCWVEDPAWEDGNVYIIPMEN